jgi:hypothetical protein
MRKSLVLAAICVLSLPLLCVSPNESSEKSPVPFSGIAMAGHVTAGGVLCPCDPVRDLCDCCGMLGMTQSQPSSGEETSLGEEPPSGANQSSDTDGASAALLLALGLLLWRFASNSIF